MEETRKLAHLMDDLICLLACLVVSMCVFIARPQTTATNWALLSCHRFAIVAQMQFYMVANGRRRSKWTFRAGASLVVVAISNSIAAVVCSFVGLVVAGQSRREENPSCHSISTVCAKQSNRASTFAWNCHGA